MASTFTCEKCGSSSYEQFSRTQVRCMHCGAISIYDTGYQPKPEFQISSDKDLLNLEFKKMDIPASIPKRIINYFVDIFIISFIYAFIGNLTDISKTINENDNLSNLQLLILLAVYAVYYIFMEYKFGKTIGKFITKTKVISANDTELSFAQCVGRFLCRIIPFEALSGLFMQGIFWHDSIPNTLVVEDQ